MRNESVICGQAIFQNGTECILHLLLCIVHVGLYIPFSLTLLFLLQKKKKIKFGENPVWMEVNAFGVGNT